MSDAIRHHRNRESWKRVFRCDVPSIMTREGSSTVRQILTEAVWQAVCRSPTVRAYLERVQRGEKARRKIAIVSTARYLVRAMWSMLKTSTVREERVTAA